MRDQARPQVGWPRAPRRGERVRLVPRPHPRDAACHGAAGEARGLPAAARGLPARGVVRPRRARSARSIPRSSAVLLEPVQGEGGVNPATAEYFAAVRRICDERGLLFMVDEVQTGFGRTGEWFGFQHMGVEPDVVTMAKALGNGVPIGACWARRDVASAFEPGDHATTFGGTPLATVRRACRARRDAADRRARAGEGRGSQARRRAEHRVRREGGARPRSPDRRRARRDRREASRLTSPSTPVSW